MYGADKYLHDENSILNNRTIKFDPDGKFTIYYGPEKACGTQKNWPLCIPDVFASGVSVGVTLNTKRSFGRL